MAISSHLYGHPTVNLLRKKIPKVCVAQRLTGNHILAFFQELQAHCNLEVESGFKNS